MPTTILIDNEIRDELKKLGSKGETYNTIVKRLIDEHNQKKPAISTIRPSP